MSEWIVLLVGLVVSSLCIAFVVASYKELRRLADSDEEPRESIIPGHREG